VAEDRGVPPARQEPRWISPAWLGYGSLVVGVFVIAAVAGHLLTDRLTIHNRTTAPTPSPLIRLHFDSERVPLMIGPSGLLLGDCRVVV
jgi:hypothetical protein